MSFGRPPSRLTAAQAGVLQRVEAGEKLVQSLHGERLWIFQHDPFDPLDDVELERLRIAGLIALDRPGSLRDDRADAYALSESGRVALASHRMTTKP